MGLPNLLSSIKYLHVLALQMNGIVAGKGPALVPAFSRLVVMDGPAWPCGGSVPRLGCLPTNTTETPERCRADNPLRTVSDIPHPALLVWSSPGTQHSIAGLLSPCRVSTCY